MSAQTVSGQVATGQPGTTRAPAGRRTASWFASPPPSAAVRDPHSAARPEEARVTHVALDLAADFTAKTLTGTATLTLARTGSAPTLVLDTADLTIVKVTDAAGHALSHALGAKDAILGQPLTVTLTPDVTKVVIEYRTSPEAAALVRDAGVEILVHHAAQMDVRRSVEDPAFDAEVNILGSLRLLEGGRRGTLRQVVFASTGGAIYGEQDFFPATEEHPVRPVSPYGVSKLAFERYLFYYHVTYGLDVTCLRYANVYG